MSNSRQKILNYIIEQKSTTVEDLSKVFRVTPSNIRHHLSILVEQGSIKTIGEKYPGARGRPAQIYSSRQQSDQNNLDQLSDAILSTLMGDPNHTTQKQLIEEIATHIGTHYKVVYANPTRKLYSTIHSLNKMGYQAHWEAHIETPRIMLGHCPYLSILEGHPELCQMDASLLEFLLDSPVRQVEKQVGDAKGLLQCVFHLQKPHS